MRLYTKAQWRWAWERFCEGYTYKDLGEFLALHPESVHRRFVRLGWLPAYRGDLPPLRERWQEFRALEDELCL